MRGTGFTKLLTVTVSLIDVSADQTLAKTGLRAEGVDYDLDAIVYALVSI